MQESLSRPMTVRVSEPTPQVVAAVVRSKLPLFESAALYCLLCVLWGLVLFVALTSLQ